jgi:hypothetical protein
MLRKIIDDALSMIGLCGHLALLFVLISRRLATRMPLFTVLIGGYVLRSGIFLVSRGTMVNPWLYWVLIGFDPVLQFALLTTIMRGWRPLAAKPIARRIFVSMSLLLAAGIAVTAAWYIGPSSRFSARNLSIKTSVFVSILWIEAAAVLLILGKRYMQQVPTLIMSVVGGFAIYSAANVLTEIGHLHFSILRKAGPYMVLSYMCIVVYLFCLVLWFNAFRHEARTVERAVSA